MKKFINYLLVAITFLACTQLVLAQEGFPVNGVSDNHERYYAFTHATILVDTSHILSNAMLVIKNGKIISVSNGSIVPKGAIEIDCKGKYIYPSFIELSSDYGVPKMQKYDRGSQEQMLSKKKGAYYWNQAIHPETEASEIFTKDADKAKQLRAEGFGTVLTHQQDGIVRGTGCLVALSDENDTQVLIAKKLSSHFSFNKGTSSQDYPSSLMGSIALLRQTYYDALWYKSLQNPVEQNLSLQAFNDLQKQIQFFDVDDKLDLLRAEKIAKEFSTKYVYKVSGDEYQLIDDIKATKASLIVPVNFPQPYDVESASNLVALPLASFKHWELAPYNFQWLEKAGLKCAITSSGCKSSDVFLKSLKKMKALGSTENQIIEALTNTPAQLINQQELIGSLSTGKLANFIICNGKLLDDRTSIQQNWINGNLFIIKEKSLNELLKAGSYTLHFYNGENYLLTVSNNAETLVAKVKSIGKDTSVLSSASISLQQKLITINFNWPKDTSKNRIRLEGSIDSLIWEGVGSSSKGDWFHWTAIYDSAGIAKSLLSSNAGVRKQKPDSLKSNPAESIGSILYPFASYGNTKIPTANNYLLKNATVWTGELPFELTNTDVLVLNGKIAGIGNEILIADKILQQGKIDTIDATGKYVTAGIIDEHSHIAATGGVNEGTHSVTSEVRIGDIINSEDINIYRQLSGGVTTSHILHGSANAIGGQTQLIKLRWGASPEKMKFEGAPGFIKFALGENVKQANWGDNATTRFPQTRMGVEQVYVDAFTRATNYKQALSNYSLSKSKEIPVRKDLELDALVEIMNSQRFITCHSYQQGEINMLMHVADSFHFKVNTFTHILEGYKVADKMKAHGIMGASTFADWWAYKFEVMEAIPYNASLMTKVGINVAVNSDDAEMGRRLNQEAAKTIKYGVMTEEEAWKMCTLNPAKMLRVDDKVGSLKKGKDADLVIWTDNPLSVYAVVDKTFVDGVCYYDRTQDAIKRDYIQTERARLINKMQKAKAAGEATQPAIANYQEVYGCGH